MKVIFLIIGILLLRIGTSIAASSALTVSSAENTFNSGFTNLSAMTTDENSLSMKELVNWVKDLELQFKQHVSKSQAEKEDLLENIATLKASKKAQQGKIQHIADEIEVLKSQNRDQMARIVQLEEILQTKIATSPIQSSSYSASQQNNNHYSQAIPSSCEDLGRNGHHLNGIYMVFDANVKKVLATYCDFRQSSAATIEQKVIGSLGINTLVGGVYFYAQMKNPFKEVGKTIPFDRIIVNQGNGLSPSNKGVFTAPRAGIYHFTFKGLAWTGSILNTQYHTIFLRHNGAAVGATTTLSGLIHVHATLKLQAGDRITMFKSTVGNLYTEDVSETHFSGWLLEEDISINI